MFSCRRSGLALVVIVVAAYAAPASMADPGAPEAIDPLEIIGARQRLMLASEELMQPIDTYTVDDSIDPESMRANAGTIAAMLAAVPALFPQSTNLYDADVDLPATLALPAVWEDFQGFYELAGVAEEAANKLAETYDSDELKSASLGLRGACDACHAVYLLPYEPAEVKPPPKDFDFGFGN